MWDDYYGCFITNLLQIGCYVHVRKKEKATEF